MADKLKILITDDSKLLRKKLRAELEQLDCEVLEAEEQPLRNVLSSDWVT